LGIAIGQVMLQPTDSSWPNQINTLSSLEVDLQPIEKVLFLHIPKTAGTTLAAILEQYFDHDKIGPFLFTQDLPNIIEEYDFDRYHYFRGHIPYGIMKLLLRAEPACLTILRDPVERYISAFAQLQRNKRQKTVHNSLNLAKQSGSIDKINLPELFNGTSRRLSVFKAYLRNQQTRMLAIRNKFNDIAGMQADISNYDSILPFLLEQELDVKPEQLLTEAKKRLSNMAFFGLTERFQDSMFLMAFTFGLPALVDYQTLNVAPSRPHQRDLPPETIQQIRAENQLDLQLYAYARQLFQERYEHMQYDLLARYGQPVHAQLALPLPQTILMDLLAQHYQWRHRQRTNPARSITYCFDQAMPGRGWHLPEQHPDFGPYRWSGPHRCSILDFVLSDETDLRITFSVIAAVSQEVLASLSLIVNEQPIGLAMKRADDGSFNFSGIIPKAVISRRPVSRVVFEVAKTIAPSQLDPAHDDDRPLGIAIRWLKINPLEA
jgi:hypothetical protein